MQYDEIITFGASGTAKQLNPIGFDFNEDKISWTTLQSCSLEMALPMPRSDMALEIDAAPFLAQDKLSGQQLFVYLNGIFQYFCTIREEETKKFQLLKSAISPRSTRLSFVIPTAATPKSLGLSSDIRELGLAIRSISFVSG